MSTLVLLILCTLMPLLFAPALGSAQDQPEPQRDFPPLVSPDAPRSPYRDPTPPSPGEPGIEEPSPGEEGPDASGSEIKPPVALPAEADTTQRYFIGVGDELSVLVVGQPDLSRAVRVLPDGSFTYPGVEGTIFALGRTADDVGQEIRQKLGRILRFPDCQLMVNTFGEQRVYVMGEVEIPGDHQFHKGMTALQALAQAGGFKSSGKQNQVVVIRRTGAESAEVFSLDLKQALIDGGARTDMPLRPFDIIFVPKTFVGNLNVFVDQWMRQNIAPFTLFLEGWNAFNVNSSRTIFR
ncbi:MAG: polysaccharide biosynthesis/export family protein [Candidatus Eisenbacteria bacterium]|nr:polysaccharide biosynthesis/export family protein [Candidatus Eisenbacteria bacterium]MCC7143133.1 polysaccharide biosynthesis/export family protein [Candidatus Eisenbacteria bacterium]